MKWNDGSFSAVGRVEQIGENALSTNCVGKRYIRNPQKTLLSRTHPSGSDCLEKTVGGLSAISFRPSRGAAGQLDYYFPPEVEFVFLRVISWGVVLAILWRSGVVMFVVRRAM